MKYILFLVFLIAALGGNAQGRLPVGRYINLENKQCLTWVSDYQKGVKYKATWTGECVDGKASGFGIMEFYTNGKLLETYEGDLSEGRYVGRGKLIVKDEFQVSGDFLNDLPDGSCEFISEKSKWKYVGTCKKGKYDGQGVLIDEEQGKYEGDFKMGSKHGNGRYYGNDGNYYIGSWIDDNEEGKGVYQFGNGDRYEGEFIKGFFSGFGIYYYKKGGRYEGLWSEGKKNGKGKEFDVNGNVTHDGKFVNSEFIEEKKTNKNDPSAELINSYVVYMTVQDCYEVRKNYAYPYLDLRTYELVKKEVKSQEIAFKGKNPKVSVDNLWVEASKQYASGVGQIMKIAKLNPQRRDGDISAICGMLNASFLNAVPNVNIPKKNF
jgi:hypothetical protein